MVTVRSVHFARSIGEVESEISCVVLAGGESQRTFTVALSSVESALVALSIR